MIVTGMSDFTSICKRKLVDWYNNSELVHVGPNEVIKIDMSNVYVVWSCKTLQNYKALLSTNIDGDGIYVEYTFNGDKGELYEDVYLKRSNRCITEE